MSLREIYNGKKYFIVQIESADLLEVNKSYSIYEGARLVATIQTLEISGDNIHEFI